MNFRKRQSSLPQFQMTAMMDIVFLLLCFFVTSTVFSQWEYNMDIELPGAQSGKGETLSSATIKFNIDAKGNVTVGARTYTTMEELNTCISELISAKVIDCKTSIVVVRADAQTSYEDFIKVVDACKRAGIRNVSLATDKTTAFSASDIEE